MDDGPKPAIVLNVHYTYPFVLLGICLHCWICNLMLLTTISPARKKAFTPEFMQQFVDEHKKSYPEDNHPLDMSGNPDQGTGWYSKKMDLIQWHDLNRSMRTHQVWLENLPFIILLPPIAGVLFPVPTLVCVYLTLILRIMFNIGYIVPSMNACRSVAHGIFQTCVMILVVTSFMTAARTMKFGDDKFRGEEEFIWNKLEELKKKYDD